MLLRARALPWQLLTALSALCGQLDVKQPGGDPDTCSGSLSQAVKDREDARPQVPTPPPVGSNERSIEAILGLDAWFKTV